MYSILITVPARSDIKAAVSYVAQFLHNKIAADSLISMLTKEIKSLEAMPERYPLVNDSYLASLGIRSLMVKNYTVFYIVHKENNTIEIVRVLYSKRNWQYLLQK